VPGWTVQTILRHFGSRDRLFDAAVTFANTEVVTERLAPVGDVAEEVRVIVDHYETRGDWVIALLGQEASNERIRGITVPGKRLHRTWVETVFGPQLSDLAKTDDPTIADLLTVATDVYAWKLLRRDRGLSRDQTERRIRLLVEAIAGQMEVLQKVLDALTGLPVRAIVTTGPAVDPDELRAIANAETHRYLPHTEVMPTVSLVIGHGGHSTTMLGLAHGMPLLILPMNLMFDQALIGYAIQQKGAGITLPSTSTPAQIRAAVERIIADGAYRQEATRLREAIRASRGTQTAADLLQVRVLEVETNQR
jgi:AcrR family transcriptional regulator